MTRTEDVEQSTGTAQTAARAVDNRRHSSLIALLFVQYLAFAIWLRSVGSMDAADVALQGVSASQLCLLGMWLGLGSTAFAIRFVFTLFGLFGWAFTCAWMQVDVFEAFSSFWEHAGTALAFGGALCLGHAVAFAALRGWRWRILHVERGQRYLDRTPWRFTLRGLLTTVTLVAVLLAAARFVLHLADLPSTWSSWAALLCFLGVYVMCFLAVSLGTVLVTLGNKLRLKRIVAVIVLVFLIGVLFGVLLDPPDFWIVAAGLSSAAVFNIASLLLVRRAGYRMVRTARIG